MPQDSVCSLVTDTNLISFYRCKNSDALQETIKGHPVDVLFLCLRRNKAQYTKEAHP